MTTKQSQAITELFDMRAMLRSMNDPRPEPLQGQDRLSDKPAGMHPTEASRLPEVFSEFCC